jgi:hypothetical protein
MRHYTKTASGASKKRTAKRKAKTRRAMTSRQIEDVARVVLKSIGVRDTRELDLSDDGRGVVVGRAMNRPDGSLRFKKIPTAFIHDTIWLHLYEQQDRPPPQRDVDDVFLALVCLVHDEQMRKDREQQRRSREQREALAKYTPEELVRHFGYWGQA